MFSGSADLSRLGFTIGDQDCTKNASPQSEKFANLRITNLLIYPDLELEIGLAQRLHHLTQRSAQLFTSRMCAYLDAGFAIEHNLFGAFNKHLKMNCFGVLVCAD